MWETRRVAIITCLPPFDTRQVIATLPAWMWLTYSSLWHEMQRGIITNNMFSKHMSATHLAVCEALCRAAVWWLGNAWSLKRLQVWSLVLPVIPSCSEVFDFSYGAVDLVTATFVQVTWHLCKRPNCQTLLPNCTFSNHAIKSLMDVHQEASASYSNNYGMPVPIYMALIIAFQRLWHGPLIISHSDMSHSPSLYGRQSNHWTIEIYNLVKIKDYWSDSYLNILNTIISTKGIRIPGKFEAPTFLCTKAVVTKPTAP